MLKIHGGKDRQCQCAAAGFLQEEVDLPAAAQLFLSAQCWRKHQRIAEMKMEAEVSRKLPKILVVQVALPGSFQQAPQQDNDDLGIDGHGAIVSYDEVGILRQRELQVRAGDCL